MKTLSILIFAMLVYTTASAQQALWGAQEIISPEIHANNTVTLRLMAPEATKVEITGDFLPTQITQTPRGESEVPGVAALTKNANGVWEYTTSSPLAPELYSYVMIVNGVRVTDPNNPYSMRDIASVTSYFIIGGGIGDLFKVNNVPHGTVSRHWYHSPGLNITRRITIYTPPGYETSNESYPVFYLLHGAGGDEEAWMALGRASQILDNLIAQGKAKPMIVVMTNGNAGQTAAPGESDRGLYKPSFMGDTRMDGAFEAAFPDIINFVESNFRTINTKAGRAIAGLSMGGFHSLHISKEYPDKFDYVGLFSSAIGVSQQNATSPVYQNFDEKLRRQFATPPKLYWVACGTTDFLYQANLDYIKLLADNNYPHVYRESDGGHIWRNWRVYLTDLVPMLFR